MSGEFVDTNVIVYAHDSSAGDKRERAAELVIGLGRERRGLLSVQVLLEFLAVITRKLEQPVPLSLASELVEDLATWRVHEPTAADVSAAARVAGRYGLSIWDAMIINAAASLDAAILWTEDLNEGQVYEGVVVRNPFRGDALS